MSVFLTAPATAQRPAVMNQRRQLQPRRDQQSPPGTPWGRRWELLVLMVLLVLQGAAGAAGSCAAPSPSRASITGPAAQGSWGSPCTRSGAPRPLCSPAHSSSSAATIWDQNYQGNFSFSRGIGLKHNLCTKSLSFNTGDKKAL